MEFKGLSCCGMTEFANICDIPDPETLIMHAYDNAGFPGIAIFSSATSKKSATESVAQKLAAYITENGLGEVVQAVPGKNPNTSNYLQAFMWTPSLSGLKKWRTAEERKNSYVETGSSGYGPHKIIRATAEERRKKQPWWRS